MYNNYIDQETTKKMFETKYPTVHLSISVYSDCEVNGPKCAAFFNISANSEPSNSGIFAT